MKKHHLLKIILSAFFPIFWMGCELETEIYSEINPTLFPQNESDVQALVDANYRVFTSYGIFTIDAGYTLQSDMVTDHVECTWGWTTVYNSFEADDWHIDGDFRRVYDNSKYLASMMLTIDRIKDVPMNQDALNNYIAEMKCGMGFLAFMLYDMYGPIPIPTLEILKEPLNEKILPRLSEEQMQEFIETNLLEAAKVLPVQYDANNYGRFTKGLAKTLLMKLYMMTERWADAEAIGQELTKAPFSYGLVPDYHSLFSLAGEINNEVIYSAINKEGVIHSQWFAHTLPGDFPTALGNTITKWGGYKISWPFYDSYEPGDKRLERLIGEYTGTDGILHNKQKDRIEGNAGSVLWYGAVPQKYAIEGVVGNMCEIDQPIYRYADVITLLAEAIVRNGNKVTQEALDYLNMVRKRVGLGNYTMSDAGDVETFLDKVLIERGHEFYLEGVRRQDLIRHRKFIPYAVKKAEWAGQSTAKIETFVDGRYKYERFPIPTKIINEGMGIITQNPGY
ncbi:RagB/SusD family nutrient uptake outer membrane protein [Bacteroides acidifaciens]|uniref:RagB/SusD family nutrient uptake outer membrane protein n=1 Tax=Bacteroides acidifaciens TaxID=85831 RepID=UPI0020CA3A0A|nr:RagB/SusD family nutrient uptake outer membrane protein [Bacteroides acidifaciens]